MADVVVAATHPSTKSMGLTESVATQSVGMTVDKAGSLNANNVIQWIVNVTVS